MDIKLEGKVLVIRIPTDAKPVSSKSGKMQLLASTHGFVRIDGTDLKLSLNLGR
jgi:hypothetical protein